jgi:hypothetical protein
MTANKTAPVNAKNGAAESKRYPAVYAKAFKNHLKMFQNLTVDDGASLAAPGL